MAMDTREIKKKTLSGVGALVLRNLLMQPISFFGFLALSIFLKRWELGVFWAVSEVVGFLGFFSDVGLAAAVIQKKEAPSKEELRATFTIQQILVVFLIAAAFLLTPLLEAKFDFQNGRFLYWVLLFGFFTSSLKTIPSVLLERRLRFEKLAMVDLTEQIVFTGLAVFLAWRGFGINSWAWAVLARSVVGVALIYRLSPWPLGISFRWRSVEGLFRFGVPFQANSLLAMLKDRLMNIFLWGILGSEGVGILGWAQRWAQVPLRFLMDAVMRVTFPAFSKLQDEKESLKKALERSGFLVNFFVFPVLAGMGFMMPKVLVLFPKYQKWAVGLFPFWLYLASFVFSAATTPLVNAFNSVGKVKITLSLMVVWTLLTWALVPILAKTRGVDGAAFGLLVVSSTSFLAWILAKREFGVSLSRIILTPLVASLGMLTVLFTVNPFLATGYAGLAALAVIGGVVYLLFTLFLAKGELAWLFNSFLQWKKEG